MAFLTALRAFKASGVKLPVNLVLVAEGEEEIGSTNFPKMLADPEVAAAVKRSVGVLMPATGQAKDGSVSIDLGAKGVVELQLVSSGERWGRGPAKDVHSSLMARVDSPAWRLVKALDTLVEVHAAGQKLHQLGRQEVDALAPCAAADLAGAEAVLVILGFRWRHLAFGHRALDEEP